MPSLALIGPPGSGKSTVFELLAGRPASRQILKAGFAADRGIVPVPDPRLERLIDLYQPKKRTPTAFELLDVPGFDQRTDERSRTAAFMEVRKTDGVAIVLDLFNGHVDATPPPDLAGRAERGARAVRDAWDQMVFADYAVVERAIGNVEMAARSRQNPDAERRFAILKRLVPALESGEGLRDLDLDEDTEKLVREYGLLTRRPVLVVANVAESDLTSGEPEAEAGALRAQCETRGWGMFVLSAKVEGEIAALESQDRAELLGAYHLAEPGLHRFARAAYAAMDLITFFTVGEDEVRGWTIPRGTAARRAAGAIHSDLERGFIRAEVVSCEDLLACGSLPEARKRGLLRVEGREYVVQDGDVCHVRFSV